jgi:4-amino-4-deoxy-L-arabinose transferase-like glycosyltransferase
MHRFLGYDEAVYVTQVYPAARPIPFTAPRARGMPWLISPVSEFSPPVFIIRYYLLAVSGALLFVAFRAWIPVLRMRAVAAAALFAAGWMTLFYGTEIMPNMPVALGDIAAAGYLAQHLFRQADDRTRRRALVKAAVAVGLVAILRPTDAIFLALGLLVAAVTRNWRLLLARSAVLGAGLVIGWLPWVIEAYLRYGGFAARMRAASTEVGGGFHPANLWHYLPLPVYGTHGTTVPVLGYVSWLLLAIGLVLAIGQAVKRRQRTAAVVAACCGLVTAAPYLLFNVYLDARYLLPAFGLLTLCLVASLPSVPAARVPRVGAWAAIMLSFAAFAGWNFHAARVLENQQYVAAGSTLQLGQDLRKLSPHGPCYFASQFGFPEIEFASGCRGEPLSGVEATSIDMSESPGSAPVYVLTFTDPDKLAIRPVPGSVRRLRNVSPAWWLFIAPRASLRVLRQLLRSY